MHRRQQWRGRQPAWMSPLVTAVHRVIFNLLSSLGELIHMAFLKGKDGLDIVLLSHHARAKCLPGGEMPSPLQRDLKARQVQFPETGGANPCLTSALLAGA